MLLKIYPFHILDPFQIIYPFKFKNPILFLINILIMTNKNDNVNVILTNASGSLFNCSLSAGI